MTQNIYDQPDFFAGYSSLQRSLLGLDGAPEWPALQRLLPPMDGARVVDLGCGFGWFCRWAAQAGAGSVLGLDVSENMLDRARAETTEPTVAYQRADLESIELVETAFDLAYSSLAFHYVEHFERLLAQIHRSLAPGGRLVFSMEHPIFTAPSAPGWLTDAAGRKTWPLDDYQIEGPRTTNWLAPGVVKQHRTLGTTLNRLIAAGFTIAHVEEWAPSDALLATRPELAEERLRPMFLLVAAQK